MGEDYPIRVDLAGELVVIVGGGTVAERRIRRLLEAGAEVRIVAPEVTDELEAAAGAGEIDWERRPYRGGDLKGARLAFAATDAPAVQSQIVDEARRRGILVDAVGRSADGDFAVPAVADLGRVRLSIDTGGASPALAAALRRHLESELDPAWGRAAEWLARLRPAVVRELEPDARRELFRALVADLPGALAEPPAPGAEAARDDSVRKRREWIERAARRAGVEGALEPLLSAVEESSGEDNGR